MARFRPAARALWHGALLGAIALVAARVMSGNGGTTSIPFGAALAGIEPDRLGFVAALGAVAGLLLSLFLRLLPEGPRRALTGGLLTGATAMLALHQSSLFVLHHAFGLAPERGFNFAPLPFGDLPAFYGLLLAGALGGAALGLALRLVPALPDLLTGFVYGAAGLSLLSALPGVPGWADPPWQWLALNGGWGWGTAFLLRPLATRGGE